jgi:predicted PurR-regulated permease PerM
MGTVSGIDRGRAGWWGVGLAAALVVGLFLYSFVGTVVLGLFFYYAARPVHRRVLARTDSRTAAATLTLLLLVLPALLLLSYASAVAIRELTAVAGEQFTEAVLTQVTNGADPLAELARDPAAFLTGFERLGDLREQVLAGLQQFGVVARGVLHLTLSLSLAFFLFRDGDRLERWFRSEIGDRDSGAHAFLRAVDNDLEQVYFGNVLTVLLVTVLSVLVYNGFNAVAPGGLLVPFPTLLALLTGLATFVPLVVGKLVYLPLTGYLAWEATRVDAGLLVVPVVFLITCFVLLDVLPQTVIRPYLSGQTLHTGLVMFSYILGVALFGWYGLFYGPLLAVFVVQFVNVALPELSRGEVVTPATARSVDIGTDPGGSDEVGDPPPQAEGSEGGDDDDRNERDDEGDTPDGDKD